MEITEVRVKLMDDRSGNQRLSAFCSVTVDNTFVLHDLKIIEGDKGRFVAMPSRKIADRCHNCGGKNCLTARFCNQCGCRLAANRMQRDQDGRAKLHVDVAHPINAAGRERIQTAVLEAYGAELARASQPGYVSSYDRWQETA